MHLKSVRQTRQILLKSRAMLLLILAAIFLSVNVMADDGSNMDFLLKRFERNVASGKKESDKTRIDREAIAKRIAEDPENTLQRLIDESLKTSKNTEYRCEVMQLISNSKSDQIARALVRNLKDKNSAVRSHAASLASTQEKSLVDDALISALADKDAEVRRNSAYSLGQHKSRKAIEPLKTLARDSDEYVSITSVWSLGEIGDPSINDFLLALLKTNDETLKMNIVGAISKLDSEEATSALRKIAESEIEANAIRQLAKDILLEKSKRK